MFAADFTDPVHARMIDVSVVGLLVLAAVVLVVTVVWWRSTRGEHPALSRLEVMGLRRYRFADDEARHTVLERVRPAGDPSDDLVVEVAVVEVAAAEDAAVVEADGDVADAPIPSNEVELPSPTSPAGVDEFLHDFADLLPSDDSSEPSEPPAGESAAPEVP